MCVIIDTNMTADFVNNKEDIKPLKRHIEGKKIKLIFPPPSTLQSEYKRHYEFNILLTEYSSQGVMKVIPQTKFEKAKKELIDKKKKSKINFKSNQEDWAILALAKASRTKLLASNDQDLMDDFKNPRIIGGSIYRDKRHKRLLNQNKCP